jgi:hypothetical protein
MQYVQSGFIPWSFHCNYCHWMTDRCVCVPDVSVSICCPIRYLERMYSGEVLYIPQTLYLWNYTKNFDKIWYAFYIQNCRTRIIFICIDSLLAGWSGDRIPVGGGGARFSAPTQTGPEAYPASYTIVIRSLSQEVKRPRRGTNHPPFSLEVKEKAELYLCSSSGPSWPVLMANFVFF